MKPAAHRNTQRGVALITAMLVVVLATVAAVAMTSRQMIDVRRSGNVLGHDQAMQVALGAEGLALRLLAQDRDSRDDIIPWEGCRTPPVPLDLEGMQLSVVLEDLHCRFNVNNLSGDDAETAQAQLVRLIEEVGAESEVRLDAEALAQALRDWFDPETDDAYYRAQMPSYLEANARLRSLSELRLVRGFDAETYAVLAPWLAALPAAPTQINARLAPEPVLAAVDMQAGADGPPSDYFRLDVLVWLDEQRRFRLCSTLDVENRRVVLREQRACEG